MRQRLAVVVLQLVIALQGAIVVTVAPAVPASPVRAAGACQVTQGAAGGMLSACPDVSSYADLVDQLRVALDTARNAGSTSKLSITSEPAGANVSINGLSAGVTPLETPLPAGSYLVRLTSEGYEPFSTTVGVASDKPSSVNAKLQTKAAGLGSFNLLTAQQLIGLVGGYADGNVDVTDFVKDKAGNFYVAFVNGTSKKFTVEPPVDAPIFLEEHPSVTQGLRIFGVAMSPDAGKTWSLVKAWRSSYSIRAWTSRKFKDGDWERVKKANGGGGPDQHYLRAYYKEETSEDFAIRSLVPLKDGGVSVMVTTVKRHLPQEVIAIYDDYAAFDYDNKWKLNPSKWIGNPISASSGEFKSVSSPEGMARWGVSRTDLATYYPIVEESNSTLDTRTGSQAPVTVAGGPPQHTPVLYQASHDTADLSTDYYLAFGYQGAVGYIYTSVDGGRNVTLETTYDLGESRDAYRRFEELRVGPDGALYLLDHAKGKIYILEKGALRVLGTAPIEAYRGLYGNDYADYLYLSADFDSTGNVHATYRGANLDQGPDVTIYYQFFPREPVQYDGVALFTEPGCAACDAARDFLKAAKVAFTENPGNLPAAVQGSVTAAIASNGYPVLARLGADAVVRGAADPATISRLLGVSHPVEVEKHPGQLARRNGDSGATVGVYPEWTLMIVEADAPSIVVERSTGVVAYTQANGTWLAQPLLSAPAHVQVSVTQTNDGQTTAFHPRYPLLPGGGRVAPGNFSIDSRAATQHDSRYNHFAKVSELAYLYRSDGGGPSNQFGYALWTTKPPETSAAYRAVEHVSQLIPSAAFYVALGKTGSPSSVGGELAAYVTNEGVVTENGQRYYRVVADLRAQNETATDGNIQARSIGGFVTVEATVDEVPDTREVSISLFVDNTRLRVFDPTSPGQAHDITSEAVHFTGDGAHWVVTNNVALPNSVPCGSDQALLLPPNSTSTYKDSAVSSFGLRSCLDALEVEPTVIAGCESWDDAKLVLGAETIESFSQSLPLERAEGGTTNYELAFGDRNAEVFRIVTLDDSRGSGPHCASEVEGRSAAVVRISGAILGATETYQPQLSIVDQGTALVSTASTGRPRGLAWEREWLELEATFLEASLRTSVGEASLGSLINLSRAGKRLGYQRDLLATRALLHCNYQGQDLPAIAALIGRTAGNSPAHMPTALCLQSFVLNPGGHWATYDPALWLGGNFEAAFLGSVINQALVANPTLAFLASAAAGEPRDYGRLLIQRAADIQARGTGGGNADLAFDLALDHYARLETVAAAGLAGARGRMTLAVLLSSPLERQLVAAVATCARSLGGDDALKRLFKLTSTRSYTSGIPCVDSAGGSQEKIDAYRRVGIGLRSGLFAALLGLSGTDLDLLDAHLKQFSEVVSQVEAAEQRYPKGTAIDAWQPELAPLDRFMVVRRHIEGLVQARGHQISVREAAQVLAGAVECGVGIVSSLVSVEGLALLGLGIGAAVAGPFAAAAGGVLFLGSGLAFTGLAVSDLAQQWELLDLQQKTAGLCGAGLSAVFAAGALRPGYIGAKRLVVSALRNDPPRVIDVRALVNRGKAAGLPLEEQATALSRKGGSLGEPPPPPSLLSGSLRALVDTLPEAKRTRVASIGEQLGYEALSPQARAVFDDLARTYGREGGLATAFERRQQQIDALNDRQLPPSPAELAPLVETGGAFLVELLPGRPKSLRVAFAGGRMVGSDAALVLAAAGDGFGPAGLEGSARRGIATAELRTGTSLMNAFLRSDRVRAALRAPGQGRRAMTPEETLYLSRLQKASRPGMRTDLISEFGGLRLLDVLGEGINGAKRLAGVPEGAPITAIDAEYIASGVFKTTHRVRVTVEGRAQPIDIAVKKGVYAQGEFQILQELGQKGLTQRPFLTSLLENVDGSEAFNVEEFVPGRTVLEALGKVDGIPAALGEFDGLLYLRTARGSGSSLRAYYNKDLHWSNVKVFEDGGRLRARAIDFDPQFMVQATTEQYLAASLLRRSSGGGIVQFAVADYPAYLDGLVRAFANEPGSSREAGVSALRRTRDVLRDPNQRGQALSVQSFPSTVDVASAANALAAQIDAYLTSH
jgi:hypothetical protein